MCYRVMESPGEIGNVLVQDSTNQEPTNTVTVLCIGDPVLDIVCHVEEEFLEKLGFECGGSASITESELHDLTEMLRKCNVSSQEYVCWDVMLG